MLLLADLVDPSATVLVLRLELRAVALALRAVRLAGNFRHYKVHGVSSPSETQKRGGTEGDSRLLK